MIHCSHPGVVDDTMKLETVGTNTGEQFAYIAFFADIGAHVYIVAIRKIACAAAATIDPIPGGQVMLGQMSADSLARAGDYERQSLS